MIGKRHITTMCPMNCLPTQCGMRVEIEDDRLLTIKGDPNNPDSHGFLCIRGRATREIFDNPKRLLTPLRRVGKRGDNTWEACSWEDAYTTIVDAIKQTQKERVGVWRGHGAGTTGVNGPLLSRFCHLGGFQSWAASIVCWALGGFGLGLTGLLETSTKEDMTANAHTILLWGATFASQPDLAPSLLAARKRGAYVVHIDTRRTEASRHVDEVILIRPGTDAALALSIAHVLINENLTNPAFLEAHTLGYAAFAEHIQPFTPEWGESLTGIAAERIRHLARLYATSTPAMIVLGGSSMFKHQHGWEAGRAIACLPALTGQLGIAGGGMGPRHGGFSHSEGYANILADVPRPRGDAYIPDHMSSIAAALNGEQIDVLLLLGTNLLAAFADANNIERGLSKVGLIVGYDLFMNETLRRCADLILPSTAWLEDIGLKQTATHIYLMERALPPEGECRSLSDILRHLADRLSLPNFFPWQDQEEYINELLTLQRLPSGTSLTVADLRERGGYWERSQLSHIAYPNLHFHTPSGKIEFWSERALNAGLSPLPTFTEPESSASETAPLRFCQGRTLTAFHSFFDEGQALPTLAKVDPTPELWLHPLDARTRDLHDGDQIIISNERGQFEATAHVTEDIQQGVVWMRNGWFGLNHLTSGVPSLPVSASKAVAGIPGGQSAYDARVNVCKKICRESKQLVSSGKQRRF